MWDKDTLTPHVPWAGIEAHAEQLVSLPIDSSAIRAGPVLFFSSVGRLKDGNA